MPILCRGCEYDLQDLPRGVCPECGRAFDPGDPESFTSSPRNYIPAWFSRTAALLLCWPAIVACLGPVMGVADWFFGTHGVSGLLPWPVEIAVKALAALLLAILPGATLLGLFFPIVVISRRPGSGLGLMAMSLASWLSLGVAIAFFGYRF